MNARQIFTRRSPTGWHGVTSGPRIAVLPAWVHLMEIRRRDKHRRDRGYLLEPCRGRRVLLLQVLPHARTLKAVGVGCAWEIYWWWHTARGCGRSLCSRGGTGQGCPPRWRMVFAGGRQMRGGCFIRAFIAATVFCCWCSEDEFRIMLG